MHRRYGTYTLPHKGTEDTAEGDRDGALTLFLPHDCCILNTIISFLFWLQWLIIINDEIIIIMISNKCDDYYYDVR